MFYVATRAPAVEASLKGWEERRLAPGCSTDCQRGVGRWRWLAEYTLEKAAEAQMQISRHGVGSYPVPAGL